jgi:hypothetical protein
MEKDVSDTVHRPPFPIEPVLYLQRFEHKTKDCLPLELRLSVSTKKFMRLTR